jgi:uncharacterized protein (TIGR03437 family)
MERFRPVLDLLRIYGVKPPTEHPIMHTRKISVRLYFSTLTLLIAPSLGLGQTITTVAGNGNAGSSGDGGPALSAAMQPNGVAVDKAGNIYIADFATSVIRKVSTAGIVSTVAGYATEPMQFTGDGVPATQSSIYILERHTGLAVDAAGNLYIADTGHDRVRKVDTSGMITTVAGIGSSFPFFGGDMGPATKATLFEPMGLALDSAGNLYIADTMNFRVRKVDTKGIITTVAGNGQSGNSGDGGPATSASLSTPLGLAVDTAGNLYIADQDTWSVRMVNTKGIITTVAGDKMFGFGGMGGPATSATLATPYAVEVDSSGNIYIADFGNARVLDVASGIINVLAGIGGQGGSVGDGGPASEASLIPNALAFDSAGNLYVADTENNSIRKITLPHPAPSVNALGVVNNASFAAGSNAIAPGAIAAVFGTDMDDGSSVLFSSFGSNGTLVTTLAGATVTINGTAVPLFYATPSQLGIQIPFDLTGSTATIEITVGGQTSVAQNVPIAPLSPGLFSTDQSGHGQGAILIANTNTLAAPTGSIPGRDSRPASPGEFITIFCTGLGAVTPALASGEPGKNNTTVSQPSVTIDGNSAMVEFSGIAPGFVGLYQVNAQVPSGTRTANDIPVVVTIGGKQSNTVTIAVSGT